MCTWEACRPTSSRSEAEAEAEAATVLGSWRSPRRVEDAVHEQLLSDAALSMAVMASRNEPGYRETGCDLSVLADRVDRFVLMTYEQHGPWSGAGTIGSLP